MPRRPRKRGASEANRASAADFPISSSAAARYRARILPLRPRALVAFEEFFFSRAGDVYPRYDFARMNDDEYGASLELE